MNSLRKMHVRRTKVELDEKECFYLWYELGTLGRVVSYLADHGIKSSHNTDAPYSYNGVRNACLRYMLSNMDEARAVLEKSGQEFSDADWDYYMVRNAKYIYEGRARGFKKWMTEHGLENRKDLRPIYIHRLPEYDNV